MFGAIAGLAGALLGGGGGNNQTATNKTNVTVQNAINNNISLKPIANAIKSTAAGTQSLLTKMQAQLALQTAATNAQATSQSQLMSIIGFTAAAFIGLYIWRH